MFYGQFRHSIDSKGRLIIPAKFRDALRENYIEKFWVTRGIERCVYVYTPREWNLLMAKFKELSLTAGKARDFLRGMVSNASEVECDKQGRIMLPGLLSMTNESCGSLMSIRSSESTAIVGPAAPVAGGRYGLSV